PTTIIPTQIFCQDSQSIVITYQGVFLNSRNYMFNFPVFTDTISVPGLSSVGCSNYTATEVYISKNQYNSWATYSDAYFNGISGWTIYHDTLTPEPNDFLWSFLNGFTNHEQPFALGNNWFYDGNKIVFT